MVGWRQQIWAKIGPEVTQVRAAFGDWLFMFGDGLTNTLAPSSWWFAWPSTLVPHGHHAKEFTRRFDIPRGYYDLFSFMHIDSDKQFWTPTQPDSSCRRHVVFQH